MNKLKSYNEIITHLKNTKGRDIHLLMGNGFSISYDSSMFSYNALHRFIQDNNDEDVQKIFGILNTQNFELVMQQLDNFSSIANVFDTPDNVITRVNNAVSSLKSGLVNAVSSLHPDHVFRVPEERSASCASFFKDFLDSNGHIFTTNYDLLMYWILLRNSKLEGYSDGFGRYAENLEDGEFVEEDKIEWSNLTWGLHKSEQNIHYLHGALPLFDEGAQIIKVQSGSKWLLDVVKDKINNNKYPVFVAAGNSEQKMEHISHNRYLSFCYDKLSEISGSLVVFGFSFGDNDKHIIDAINKAAKPRSSDPFLLSVYIGVYSQSDINHINSIKKKFQCRKVEMFDARTVKIWGE